MKFKFQVYGIPKPGGSKRPFRNPKTGGIILVDACKKNKQWRDTVVSACMEHYHGKPSFLPLALRVTFHLPRPKGHYRKNGELRDTAPRHCTTRPDATKLLRSTEDALTKILWLDDAQIVHQEVFKQYANGPPGATIEVEELPQLWDEAEGVKNSPLCFEGVTY